MGGTSQLSQEQFKAFLLKAFNVKEGDIEVTEKKLSDNNWKISYSLVIKGQSALYILDFFTEANEKYVETEMVYRKFKNRLTQIYDTDNKSAFLKIIRDLAPSSS